MHSPAHRAPSAAQEDLAFQRIEELAKNRLGLHFAPERRSAMKKRLLELAAKLSVDSLTSLLAKLRSDSGQYGTLLADALSTNHTAFFRESVVLQRIPDEILPAFSRRREPVRIWCAASSTGQEVYSVAILLAEALGPDAAKQRFSTLGTDLVRRVVAVAEAGEYLPAAMKDVSAARRAQWFTSAELGRHRVRDEIKAICTFRQLNLVARKWPFEKKFGLILCRNVLYYFDRDTQVSILRRLHGVCEPGGWLLTSVSESLNGVDGLWRTISPGVHRKVER